MSHIIHDGANVLFKVDRRELI